MNVIDLFRVSWILTSIIYQTCFITLFHLFSFSMGRNGFWCPYCEKHCDKPFEHLCDDKKRSKCMQTLRDEGTTPEAVVNWYKSASKRWHTLAPSAAEIDRLGLDVETLLYAGIPVPRHLLRDYKGPTPVGGWRWCPTPPSTKSTEPQSKGKTQSSKTKTRRISVIKMNPRERRRAAPETSTEPTDAESKPRPFSSPLATVAERSREYYLLCQKRRNPFSRFR